jgi:abhydrolase domain-containing protein 6
MIALLATACSLRGAWVRVGRGKLWVRSGREGRGRPLLFVHGLGRGGAQLVPLALAFAAVRNPLVPDLFDLGGKSTSRAGTTNVEEHAASLAELTDAYGRVDVVGVSLGGWVATALAAHYPERVRTLFLVNPAGARHDAEATESLFRETARAPELYRRVVRGRPFLGVPLLSQAVERGFLHALCTRETTSFLDSVHSTHFVDALVDRVTCPTFLVLSESDQLLRPEATAATYRRGVRDLSGVWVEGASHNLGYEAPETLLRLLSTFLGHPQALTTPVARLARHLRTPPALRPLTVTS